MECRHILFEQSGPVAVLTLNRPEIRNALTGLEMIDEIEAVCKKVQTDSDVSVLIVTGAGPAFSGGGNVKDMFNKSSMFSGDPAQIRENYRSGIQRIPLAFHRLDVVTIAAVNGPAIGAGCDLACMCDIRLASEKARFAFSYPGWSGFPKLANWPSPHGSSMLRKPCASAW
jgi:enoyl-CoA hydratase/carnithine racemase